MKLLRGLFRRILSLLLLVLLAAGVLFLLPLTEQTDTEGLPQDASWMGTLPDSLRLNEITIPGTHASASQFTALPFFTRCQASGIGEQLAMGFRLLDVSLAVVGETNGMKLCSGSASCTVSALPNAEALGLDAVLEECYAFLAEHPTETILFSVTRQSGEATAAEFEAVLYSHILQHAGSWLLTDTVPTLGEARGKLVLLRGYEDEARLGAVAGIPLVYASQSGSKAALTAEAVSNGSYTLYVQDLADLNDTDKWTAFTAGMAAGRAQTALGNISLSFLSTKGSLPVGHPWAHAQKLNAALRNRGEDLSGWILLDFGEPYLARQIYESNALYGTQTVSASAASSAAASASASGGSADPAMHIA